MRKPIVLCILDGVGIAPGTEHNAVTSAKTPFIDELLQKYPHSQLAASGAAVGLPNGIMGNSEVGHITIGSGRVVNQFLRRFELANWEENAPLADFIADVRASGGVVHVAGLMSDGRVHADVRNTITIMRRILMAGLNVIVHFIADGRDTPPKSAMGYVNLIRSELDEYFNDGRARFGTLTGRYYSMDRNHNMDRTEIAFDAIARGESKYHARDIDTALREAYERGETDEFIYPIVIDGDAPITPKDGFLFTNYRSDRARQIVREMIGTRARMLCFSQYGEGLDSHCPALLPDIETKNTLGDVLAAHGLSQLRIAETEKYNHVTYFFDAERNIDFAGGEKILIPSPDVATFDMKPEMSAAEITDALLPKLGQFDVVILNYANGDMVGHTGNEDAAIRAMEFLDAQLAQLVPAVLGMGGAVLITADHGNAEQMWDNEHNGPWTAHTTNPVNFIYVANDATPVHDGGLADIAPTILHLAGVPVPDDMTGKSLVD